MTQAQMVAFKVFSNKNDFQLEKRNLDYLKESLSAHKHVIVHLAAIVRGSEFYIFLPYTDLGSLEVFLCGGIDETPGTDLHKISYDFDAKFPPENIRPVHLLRQMMNLCGALSFLHHNLHDGQSQTYCAHLDLRPQNVLVFGAETEPVGSWKISDFGISSFKKVINTKEQVFLSIRDLAEQQTSTATNRNLEGAHRSPENHSTNTEPFSGRKSDMWSFACILCEVLAFSLGGKSFLKDFRKQRTQGNAGENDAFFSVGEKRAADSPTTESIINGSVVHWLQRLSDQFVKERFLVENVVELILSTLRIVPGERLRANQVYEKLELMLRNHSNPSGTTIAPPSSMIDNGSDPVPKHDNGRMQDGVLDLQSSPFRSSATQLGIWKLDLPVSNDFRHRFGLGKSKFGEQSHSVKDWRISPFGDRVAFLLQYRKAEKFSVYVFSTEVGNSGDPLVAIEELPSGITWQTLELANPHLSVCGWRARSGTKVILLAHLLPEIYLQARYLCEILENGKISMCLIISN